MKRCPQCEFIYEDEQTMCDMDGTMLALDQSAAVVEGRRSVAKSFAVPAIAGTALAAVLFLAFYTSPLLIAKPDEHSLSPAQIPSTNSVPVPTPVQPAAPEASPLSSSEVALEQARADRTERTFDSNQAKSADNRLTIRRGLPPLPRVPSLPRLPPARVKRGSTANEETPTQPKKQSKVESFFKKTGRVISKPFKF